MVLETPRLILREITLADLDFMAALLGDPEVMRFGPRPKTRPKAEQEILKIQSKYAQGRLQLLGIMFAGFEHVIMAIEKRDFLAQKP
jgi:RimJ/RimL family protein N-acetyltransferase